MRKQSVETSTDYARPYRPLPIRAFNYIGRIRGNRGWPGPLKVESLIDLAVRKTGLTDFGDDGHAQALEALVESINDEADLTATGWLLQKSRIASALISRLRVQELLRKHPEIHDIDLGSVILITGLQRTGTTLLHRLLFAHPETRGLTGGEALVPIPEGGGKARSRAEAIRRSRALMAQRAIGYLSPQFNAVHPIDPDAPEEDVMLLDLNFMSQTPEATMRVPAYSSWLEGRDHTRTYAYFRTVLKILNWQRPGGRWVLKTPHHMEYLEVFLKVFPEALIVQTHRDPRRTIPSFCSMVAHAQAIFSDTIDPGEIAGHWFRKIRRMVSITMRTREESNADRFLDVSYYDLTNNPIAELERITGFAGIGLDDNTRRIAGQFLKSHPQNRFGKHHYHLSDFGLTEDDIDKHLSSYRKKYAVPIE